MFRALTILGSLLIVGAAPAAQAPAPAPAQSKFNCPEKLRHAKDQGQAVGPRRLGDEPPANVYLSLYRRDAKGCADPVVVRYGVGASSRPRENPRR